MTNLNFTAPKSVLADECWADSNPVVSRASRVKGTLLRSTLCFSVLALAGCALPGRDDPLASQSPPTLSRAESTSARACRERGLHLAAEQQDDEAIAQLEKARELAPGMKGVAHPLAVLYDRQGQWTAASSEYRRALQESPDDADLLNDYGYFLYTQGELERAEETLLRCLKSMPSHPKARLNLAMVFAAEGRMDEAFAEFESSVGTAAAHHNTGMLLARAGHKDDALAHLQRAAELDPEFRQTAQVIASLETESMNSYSAIRQVSGERSEVSNWQLAD
ncbi:tetratricopeptide repeat protein [Thalassoglobus neptunius]|uniref:tetratricopeptide repeat protein n=1 Tax=Thalassoglobus neptunius TaxID=1938619 RepID=UPI0018D20732|nr:tetratricopeptide repeat protein [Thalassoglobus neptunius]